MPIMDSVRGPHALGLLRITENWARRNRYRVCEDHAAPRADGGAMPPRSTMPSIAASYTYASGPARFTGDSITLGSKVIRDAAPTANWTRVVPPAAYAATA